MRTHFLTLLLFFVCWGFIFATEEILPYKTDVIIDGCNKEWRSPLPKYDKLTGINYSVANNERGLFFIIRVADEATQRQIFQNGMEVWINLQGKKKKVTGVTFPLPMIKDPQKAKIGPSGQMNQSGQERQPRQLEQSGQSEQNMFPSGMGQGMPMPIQDLILTGFLLENGKQPTNNCPVQVSLSTDQSNCLIYELAIPFNTFYKESLDRNDANLKVCVGFVIKGEDTTKSESQMDGAGGMGGMGGPGGGGMRGPGGMGGPGAMGGPGDMGSMNTSANVRDKTLWFKTSLNIQ